MTTRPGSSSSPLGGDLGDAVLERGTARARRRLERDVAPAVGLAGVEEVMGDRLVRLDDLREADREALQKQYEEIRQQIRQRYEAERERILGYEPQER